MRLISHKLLMDMRFMNKSGTCNTKNKISVGEVIDPVCVWLVVSHQLYAMVESVMEAV